MKGTLALSLLTLAALGAAEDRFVNGSVAYRERIALSDKAKVRVVIEDVSIADRAAPVIAETTIEPKGKQVPIPFSIKFDSGQVREGGRYAIRAQIYEGSRLAFTTDMHHALKLDGSDSEQLLVLNKVAAPSPSSIEDTRWLLYELNGSRALLKGARESFLTFNADDRKFGAYAGVNQIGGGYTLDGFKLSFSEIYSTLMAGPDNLMKQERDFMMMLTSATKAKQFGDHLVIYKGDKTVAKFKSSNAQ
jgi:putative lipoprotein